MIRRQQLLIAWRPVLKTVYVSQYVLDGGGRGAGGLRGGRQGGVGQQEGVLGGQGRIDRTEVDDVGQDVCGQPAEEVHE